MLRIRDPVLFWPLDPGWKKSQIRDKYPSHISESLSTIFWAKINYSLLRTWCLFDPGSVTGMEKFGSPGCLSWIRNTGKHNPCWNGRDSQQCSVLEITLVVVALGRFVLKLESFLHRIRAFPGPCEFGLCVSSIGIPCPVNLSTGTYWLLHAWTYPHFWLQQYKFRRYFLLFTLVCSYAGMLQTYFTTKLETGRIQSISGPTAGFRFFKIRWFNFVTLLLIKPTR